MYRSRRMHSTQADIDRFQKLLIFSVKERKEYDGSVLFPIK